MFLFCFSQVAKISLQRCGQFAPLSSLFFHRLSPLRFEQRACKGMAGDSHLTWLTSNTHSSRSRLFDVIFAMDGGEGGGHLSSKNGEQSLFVAALKPLGDPGARMILRPNPDKRDIQSIWSRQQPRYRRRRPCK